MIDIEKFENEIAYNASSSDNWRISLIKDINTVIFDGINIPTTQPEIGDAVYEDNSTHKPVFFKGGDKFDSTKLPDGLTPIGVVIDRQGYKVLIHYYTSPNKKYQDIKRWNLTGFQLDGNEHTSYINITWTTTASGNLEVIYTATTINQLISKLNEVIKANDPTTDKRWWATTDDNSRILIQCDNHTNYQQTVTASGGFTSTLIDNTEIETVTIIPRKAGFSTFYALNNYDRALQYFSTSGENSTAVRAWNYPTIVRRTIFEDSEYGVNLKNHFGTYENYIAQSMAKIPSNRAILGWHDRTQLITDTYGAKTTLKQDGNIYPIFPAPNYIYNLTTTCEGLSKWRQISVKEDLELALKTTYGLSGINYNNCDIINKTLYKMGGNVISLAAGRWLSGRSTANSGWYRSSTGYVHYYYYWCYAFLVSAVALLSI